MTHQGPRTRATTEPDFARTECVVGLECRIRQDKKWHTGRVTKIHSHRGMNLYRFQSPDIYVLVTRGELKRTKENNT